MHPLALTSYPRRVTLTPTRSSRRRARRAAIAVVAGLLGAGAGVGQAHADPPQHQFHGHLPGSHANVHQLPDWSSVDPPRPFDQPVAATGGRTEPLGSPSDGGSVDAWPGALIVLGAGALGAVTLARRHRSPTAT
jgi:hypothetical protein